ncbi:MAG: hypothetical protein DRG66_04415, partial [Deltaproteobacteria bacterium]
PPLFLPAVFLEGLSAVFLVRRLCGGVAEWRTGLLTISRPYHSQEGKFMIQVMAPIHKLL